MRLGRKPNVFFAAAVGTTTTTTVGLPIAIGTIRTTGTTITGFVWFFRKSLFCWNYVKGFR